MPEEENPRRPESQPVGTAAFAAAAQPGGSAQQRDQAAAGSAGQPALFPDSEAQSMQARWHEVQASFVDEPRRAVEQADELVAAAMSRLAETFADERARLEAQWDKGGDVSTEDLRLALQRYRSFFSRLLSI